MVGVYLYNQMHRLIVGSVWHQLVFGSYTKWIKKLIVGSAQIMVSKSLSIRVGSKPQMFQRFEGYSK